MRRIKRKEKLIYVLIGVLLVAAITMLMSVRVQSRTQESILFDNRNYESAEEAYKKQVQQVLEDYSCYHSGLTMTRIVSLDGEREYNIQIYNAKFESLSAEIFDGLKQEIETCYVVAPGGERYDVAVSFSK
ncbi:MAG: hypothetical protein E7289_07310 [Lachnospiraceae bacterium]|nr:hypothetical protein [Lachnospiraceae bacterium]